MPILHSFNAASTNLLKKCLKRIMSIMSTTGFSNFYKPPSTELVESIIFTSNGDIRNAVINLHFASQKSWFAFTFFCEWFFISFLHLDSGSLDVKAVQTTSKTKGSKMNNKFRSLGCDDSITFMHALGRVINPKCKSFKIIIFKTFD